LFSPQLLEDWANICVAAQKFSNGREKLSEAFIVLLASGWRCKNSDKQKEGKKKMRQFGKVDIPQEAFIAALKMDEN